MAAKKATPKKAAKKAPRKAAVEPRIAASAGSASNRGLKSGPSPNGPNPVEEAMSKAVLKAMSEGITDPLEHRKRMAQARAEVLGKR